MHPFNGEIVNPLSFDGATYDPKLDGARLSGQLLAVFGVMRDGEWHTLEDIGDRICNPSTASVSARLRDLRKPRFGGHIVERSHCPVAGVWLYRVTVSDKGVE